MNRFFFLLISAVFVLYARPRLIRSLFCIIKYIEGAAHIERLIYAHEMLLSNKHLCVSATSGYHFAATPSLYALRSDKRNKNKKKYYRRIIMIINFVYTLWRVPTWWSSFAFAGYFSTEFISLTAIMNIHIY